MPASTRAGDPEERAEHLRRQLTAIERLARLGAFEWEIGTDHISWSEELYRLFGLRPGEVPPSYEAYLGLIHPEDRDRVDAVIRTSVARHEAFAIEHRLIRPDGSQRWLACRGTVVADKEGRPTWVYGIAVDVTEAKGTEKALRDFIADAAHELRTPAAAIAQGSAMLSSGRLRTDRERDDVVEALRRQADRLLRLTNQLLDLSALDQGVVSILMRSVRVAPVVRSALRQASLEQRDVQVEVPEDLYVRAEATRLEQVLIHLLEHAGRFGGPHVRVVAHGEEDEVVLHVEDDGPGLPDELVPSLFVPFQRAFRGGSAGAAVDLPLAQRWATVMGGRLSHEHVRPHGARFVLRLEAPRPGE